MIIDQVVLTENKISSIIKNLSEKIIHYYWETDEILMIGILEGALYFATDLKKMLPEKFDLTFVKATSYENNKSTGQVNIDFTSTGPIMGRNILLIDDIYDTGQTLYALSKKIKETEITSFATCVLLNRINNHQKQIDVTFNGYNIEDDKFLVGYGLDYEGEHREMPYIISVKN